MRTTALLLVCALILPGSALAQETQNDQDVQQAPPTRRRRQRGTPPARPQQQKAEPQQTRPPPDPDRDAIAPQSTLVQASPARPSRKTPPPTTIPIDKKE